MKIKCDAKDLNGIYNGIAAMSSLETAERIFNEYRGQQVTFPMELYSKEYIYSKIKDEYNGTNVKQLAQKYNYSERTVRRIVKGND